MSNPDEFKLKEIYDGEILIKIKCDVD